MAINVNSLKCSICHVSLRSRDDSKGGTICTCPTCGKTAALDIVIDYVLAHSYDASRCSEQQIPNTVEHRGPFRCYHFYTDR